MEYVKKKCGEEDEPSVEDIKVDFCCLKNAERTSGILQYSIDWPSDYKSTGDVKNDDPAFPRDGQIGALARWVIDNAAVHNVQDRCEEAEEIDLES